MRLSLASKISAILVGMLALALFSSGVAVVSAYRQQAVLRTVIVENLTSLRAAEELEIALLEQRGYVSSYILDAGNTEWLQELNERRDAFDQWIIRARETARTSQEREILDRLEMVHRTYSQKRDDVVDLYDRGQQDEAKQALLRDVTALYQQCYELCEAFIAANEALVEARSSRANRQVEVMTLLVAVSLLVTVGLGFTLLGLFFYGVIFPLRRMSADARRTAGEPYSGFGEPAGDELRELGYYVKLLMADVQEARSDLQHSRTQLAHADKLAAVGKLAASVAHEIRNPLTSMKMWLYSLRRTAGGSEERQQKLDMISEEIVRLDNIVRHFLEFSRPAELKLSVLTIGSLLDKTIELVHHHLNEHKIRVTRDDEQRLPEIRADTEQIRQVLLNLIINAIEAMPRGGELRISTSQSRRGEGDMVKVRIADTGPGISREVQDRMFEPFFTTKAEGTGLGLCIAASIMARHGGALVLESSNAHGTQWAIWIPIVRSRQNV